MRLDSIVTGLLSEREYRNRRLVLERGRTGADRKAAQAQARFWRALVLDATKAVLRHLERGTAGTEWGARCRETLVQARGKYLEAVSRLDAINGRAAAE